MSCFSVILFNECCQLLLRRLSRGGLTPSSIVFAYAKPHSVKSTMVDAFPFPDPEVNPRSVAFLVVTILLGGLSFVWPCRILASLPAFLSDIASH